MICEWIIINFSVSLVLYIKILIKWMNDPFFSIYDFLYQTFDVNVIDHLEPAWLEIYLMYRRLQVEVVHYRIHALRGIPIDGVTGPSGENEHQFWDNLNFLKH